MTYLDPRLPDRFWAKTVVHPLTRCWLWTAALSGSRYGAFKWWSRRERNGNRMAKAHRIAYETLVGVVPEGLELDHLCRVRHCVNPAHLEPVTHQTNLQRGEGFGDHHLRKTHCPHGHQYDEANTRNVKTAPGRHAQRVCRACDRARKIDRQ